MPRYATTAAQYGLATTQSRKISWVFVALALAMIAVAYLILSATVGGGELLAPRYHRHHHLA